MQYQLNDIVQLKKNHPCRMSEHWQIIRMGVDIKVKCLGCGAVVMFERPDFEKRLKKIIQKAENND